MEHILDVLNNPWKLWGFLGPVLASFMTLLVNRRLTRYKECISRLHNDLTAVRDLCKQAYIDASELKPCLYNEAQGALEPRDDLHQLLEFPKFRDKKFTNELREFIK